MQDSMKHSTFKRITAFGITILAVLALNAAAQDAKPAESAKSSSPINEDRRIDLRRMQSECDYRAIVKAYADYMIEHGRDRYGQVHSPLFMTVLNRKTGHAFKPPYPHVITKPYAPGLRRDHKMRPYDRTYQGSNPLEDIPLYEPLYRYTDLTGDKRYAAEADKSIAWFFEHGWSPRTKLPGWGSHMYYDVNSDMAVFAGGNPEGGYGGHEYNYVWPYWDQTPQALNRFACELWNQHIKDKKTGGFNRHSTDGGTGMEFPQTGSCYMDAWAREYGRSGDPEMQAHIETLLKLFHSMRDPNTGAMAWCSAKGADRREVASVGMNLFMATTLQDAAAHVEERDPELAGEMHQFVRFIDDEYLSNEYNKILDVAGKGIMTWYTVSDRTCMAKGFTAPPGGVDVSVGFPLTTPDGTPAASLYYLSPWFPGRSYAGFSNLLRDRYEHCEEKHKATNRRALLDTADIYMSIGPEVQFAQYPDNIADAVALLRYVYKLTDNAAYLHRADQIMQMCRGKGTPDEFIDTPNKWNRGLCHSCGKQPAPQPELISDGLVLHLSGDALGELAAISAVDEWKSQAAPKLVATAEGDRRPTVVRQGEHTLLRFDGKDDYLTIPDDDSLDLQPWTLFAVIRHEGGAGVVLTKTDERNHMMNYRLQVGDGGVSGVVRGPSAKHQVNRNAAIEILNRYAVVAARFDPTATGVDKIALMIDGAPATQHTWENADGSVTDITHDRPLEIGRQPGKEPRYFNGEIAEILLYNRALHRLEQTQVASWLQQQ